MAVSPSNSTWVGVEDRSAETGELRTCGVSGLLRSMAKRPRFRGRAMKLALKYEGGQFTSATYRAIVRDVFGVELGAHSYGPWPGVGILPKGVIVGRYVSIASGVRMYVRNHPFERLSMHPYFYNRALGFVDSDTIEEHGLEIGHDAWLGDNSMILPGCRRVGIGAVVGAGAIVTRDVPDFAVVAGNPAKVLKMRFDESGCRHILNSRWWEHPPERLAEVLPDMLRDISDDPSTHPLVSQAAR